MYILKKSLFLTILLLIVPLKTCNVTASQALTVTAAAAAAGIVGYQVYNYAHYHSEANGKAILDKLDQKLQAPDNIYFIAAYSNSIDALFPLYKKEIGHTTSISEITKQIRERAQLALDAVMLDHENLKKYSLYLQGNYEEKIAHCERSLRILQIFYNNLEAAGDFTFIQQQLVDYLHTNLYEKLTAPLGDSAYPLSAYKETLTEAYSLYKEFLKNNQIIDTRAELLLKESLQKITAIEESSEFLKETIRSLQARNSSLSSEVSSLSSKVSSLHSKVRSLESDLSYAKYNQQYYSGYR